jgi:hypothetical protein
MTPSGAFTQSMALGPLNVFVPSRSPQHASPAVLDGANAYRASAGEDEATRT